MVDWLNLGKTDIVPPDMRKLAQSIATFKQPPKPQPLPVPKIRKVNVDWSRVLEELGEKYVFTHISVAAGMSETYLNNAKRYKKFDPPYSVARYLLALHRKTFGEEFHKGVYFNE